QFCTISVLSSPLTASTAFYTLSLHDALPIFPPRDVVGGARRQHLDLRVFGEMFGDVTRVQLRAAVDRLAVALNDDGQFHCSSTRSEEHTSELQSRVDLVCRLLLEKTNAALPT